MDGFFEFEVLLKKLNFFYYITFIIVYQFYEISFDLLYKNYVLHLLRVHLYLIYFFS